MIKDFLILDDSVVLCGHIHHGLAWWMFLVNGWALVYKFI